MKKVLVMFLIACILCSVAGCSIPNDTDTLIPPKDTVFTIKSYNLQLTADSTFEENTGGSYDLQITNGSTYVSIMAFQYIDLPSNLTPMDVYDMQNEDLFSKRTAVKIIEEAKTQAIAQRTITHALYSAEKNGVKNYYASYLIDLPDAETFAWVLVTAAPSYLSANRDFLHNIVCSLTTIE